MKALNVRLGPEDSRAIATLRSRGLNVSELVREHVRELAAEPAPKPARTVAELDDLFAEIDRIRKGKPMNWRSRGVDITDRRSVKEYMRRKIRGEFRRNK